MLLSSSSASSGPIELGVRFYLKDQFSGPVGRMKEAMNGLRGEYTAMQDNLRAARNIATTMAATGMALTYGMGRAIATGADFHYMLRSVEAISEGTAQQMTVLTEQAINLGRKTMFFPKDIAHGMRFMAMAGQDALTIHKTIDAATNLAGATMMGIGGKMAAADILTNALKAFGWEAERSAEMSDVLVLATNNANVSLSDLGNSIRYAAATARNLRVPVQETTGLLMSLGNAGIQGSMAGVAVENMMRYLAISLSDFAPKRSQAAWASLGISREEILDAQGNLKPIVEILTMIENSAAGFGSVQRQNILRDIFGVRGLRAAATLLQNLDQTKGFIDMLKDPTNAGTAAKKMELMMDSVQGGIWKVQSAWQGLQAAFTSATQVSVQMMLEKLAQVVGKIADFLNTPFGAWVGRTVLTFTAVATVIWTLKAAVIGLAYSIRTLNVTALGMKTSVRTALEVATARAAGMAGIAAPLSGRALGATLTPVGRVVPPNTAQATWNPMFMGFQSRGPGGRFAGKASQLTPAQSAFQDQRRLRNIAPYRNPFIPTRIGMGAKIGGGLLLAGKGIMTLLGGPVGLGIMAAATILPPLVSAISRNSSAVDKNSEILEAASMKASSQVAYNMVSNKRVADVVEIMSRNIARLVNSNERNLEDVISILTGSDMNALSQLLENFVVPGQSNPGIITSKY